MYVAFGILETLKEGRGPLVQPWSRHRLCAFADIAIVVRLS